MNFKEKYKNEMDSLSFSLDYEVRLTERLKKGEKKKTAAVINKKKIFSLIAAVISAITILSVITVAEPSQHSPDATTVKFQTSVTDFEDRWKKSKKFPYESGDEESAFTVLGITSGSFLNKCDGFSADANREYFISAIRGRDGIDLTLKGGEFPIKITPLIYGREPWETNSSTLCEDVIINEKNGVIYYLFDTSFLDRFEGRIICFACYEGESPTSEFFTMEENGVITYSKNYKSFGRIIEMPLDMSDTHPEIAEEILLNDELSKLY